MAFFKGKSYTRDEIHAQLKGETVSYLPQHEGRIVCGCFNPKLDPEAPEVVLLGGSPDDPDHIVVKKARLLATQTEPIPIFLKEDSNEWAYDGDYRVKGVIEDRRWLEEKQKKAARTDVVMAVLMERVHKITPTYLLTWNPHNWPWKTLEDQVRQTAEGKPSEDRWSCGNTKRIKPGDRLFLLRQGEEPRGIMAAGWATSPSYEGTHWDELRREQGELANHVNLRFDRILNPEVDEILPLSKLQTGPLASVNWATPASGIEIKQGADLLIQMWDELLGFYPPLPVIDLEQGAIEGELRIASYRHRARELWLREQKIAQAKAAANGHLPCEVCEFDFLNAYGELGRDYAQVHHLKSLADRIKPSLTKLSDLAVVCANCHMMIHRGGQVRALNEVRASIRQDNWKRGRNV